MSRMREKDVWRNGKEKRVKESARAKPAYNVTVFIVTRIGFSVHIARAFTIKCM